jgi:hypothetical protein
MSQIDVLMAYADKPTALADPTLAAFVKNGAFDASRVFDNAGAGLQIWSTANDTTTTATGLAGQAIAVTQHQYQPGYVLIVSYNEPASSAAAPNAQAPSLAPFKADAGCVLIADRDAAAAANPGFILYATQTDAQLAPMRLQPTPLGASYPFGSP